jgi:hypothetical protein
MVDPVLNTDALLIATPLLVLAIVLLLGFAGCSFEPGQAQPPVEPDPRLRFRVRVPSNLTVTAGVTFTWTRPTSVVESAVVTVPTATSPEQVFEQEVPTPEPGAWVGRCEMDAIESDVVATSQDHPFTPDFTTTPDTVVAFHAEGSPSAGTFQIIFDGLIPG